MTTLTLDDVFALVDRLAPDDKRRLIQHLTPQISAVQSKHDDTAARLQQLHQEIIADGPVARLPGQVLDDDRRARATLLTDGAMVVALRR